MLELQPRKCNTWIRLFQCGLTVAHLADEYSIVTEETRCMMQDGGD